MKNSRLRERLRTLRHGLYRDFSVEVWYTGQDELLAKMRGELEAPYGWVSVQAMSARRISARLWRVHLRGIWVGTQRVLPEPAARRELLGIDLWILLGLGFVLGVAIGGVLG